MCIGGSMEINGHNWIVLEESYISNVSVSYLSPREVQSKERWVCSYCNKIIDRANFTDFIEESNNRAAERHGWQLVADRLPD